MSVQAYSPTNDLPHITIIEYNEEAKNCKTSHLVGVSSVSQKTCCYTALNFNHRVGHTTKQDVRCLL